MARKKSHSQKRAAIVKLLQADPKRSNRAISKAVGVDHKTVAAVRKAEKMGGEIPHKIPHVKKRIARAGGGRPGRADASEKALAGVPFDPAAVDPLHVLAEIAADKSAPAAARVAASKALVELRPGDPDLFDRAGVPLDRLSQRAVQLLNRSKAN